MSKEDKKLQKHLVDEMMKVYENNPNVMIYMQSLMENYEKLEQENKQLKELKFKFFDNSGDEESFTLEDYLEISNKLYDYEEENKQLKEELEKKNKKYWQQQCAYYSSILYSLEEWLKDEKDYYFENYYYSDFNAYGSELNDVLDKIQELKEKYK